MAKEKVLGGYKKKLPKKEPVFINDGGSLGEMIQKHQLDNNSMYRKQFRDHIASTVIPTTIKMYSTIEEATSSAYKVADLMLAESDKYKP